jgi:outer membrane protein OmpA-like peptidoglycan-associated protein
MQSLPPLIMSDLLKKASGILDTSQQAIDNATMATAHINSVTAKIDDGQGTIGSLVNDKQIYNNVDQTTAALQATMVHAQAGVTDFQENMEALKHNFLLSGYFKKRGYEDSDDLAANGIKELPQAAPVKEFTFTARQLFDKQDSAKLKDQKLLKAAGDFLADNKFGFAVIVVSSGMEGDTQKDLVLTEARAMVVRDSLVDNFGFDDSQLKTLGMGKQAGANLEADWGSIRILIYPAGTDLPPETKPPVAVTTGIALESPASAAADSTQKQ